jgi:hypothetical protein
VLVAISASYQIAALESSAVVACLEQDGYGHPRTYQHRCLTAPLRISIACSQHWIFLKVFASDKLCCHSIVYDQNAPQRLSADGLGYEEQLFCQTRHTAQEIANVFGAGSTSAITSPAMLVGFR